MPSVRQAIFDKIRNKLVQLLENKGQPIRLAINGIEGTGKTFFAKELVAYLIGQKMNAIQVSIDGYHHTRAIRYRQGRDSAKGYYEDAYNEEAFVEYVLEASQQVPFSYVDTIHDLESDKILEPVYQEILFNTILITDGAYLLKPTYQSHWDLVIYLKTSFDIARQRGVVRDAEALGGKEIATQKFLNRYHKASQLYILECQPERNADIIIDNSQFDQPIWLKG